MGYFNDLSLTPNTRPFADEGRSFHSEPLPDGLRIAHYSEPGWTYRTATHRLWVTDAPPRGEAKPIIITFDNGKYFIESYRDGAVWATAFSRAHLSEIIARHGYVVVADYAEEVGR